MRVSRTAVLLVLFLSFLTLLTALPQAEAEVSDVNVRNFPETQQIKGDVQVTNFPSTQQIRGSVSVEGTTKYITRDGVIVQPSRRADMNEMVYAGAIDTDGFTSVMISMQGEMRSDVFSSGTVGVLLVPDEKAIVRLLRDSGRLPYAIECKAPANSRDSIYFESEQVQQRIGFARYKVFLYNTTNKQAEANLYFYLAHASTVVVPGNAAK